MNLYTQQDANIRKTWLLMFVFLVVVVAIGWFLSYWYNNPIILYIAVIFSILMNFFSYWFSDRIVIHLSGAKQITREQAPELWNIVENLSITAGLPMPRVYIVQDVAPNAFATGRDKEHAVVAVTTGLLAILNKTELEGVIAHELSHIGNRDMLIGTVAVVLVGFVSIISDMFFRSMFFGHGDNRKGGHPVIMIIGVIGVIIAPIIAMLIRLAISRKREFLADSSGALLTRYPEGLASALEKISQHGAPLAKAHNATAHLFIANPFGPEASTHFFTKLFMTHPPAEERIRILRGH